jgi:hypothetical protein
MRPILFMSLALSLFLSSPVSADDAAAKKLGEAYEKASEVEKYVMVAVNKASKVINYKESGALIDAIVRRVLAPAKTSADKLQKLGELRATVTKKVRETSSKWRKAKKKGYVSFEEPKGALQQAITARYVCDTAGPQPTIDGLICLKTVRECTSWGSTGSVILAFLQEALSRDAPYLKADHEGKLDIIRKLTGKGMMSNFTRAALEKPVLADWISTQIKAGKAPADISKDLTNMGRAGSICFFSRSWADSYVKAMGTLDFGKKE